MSKAKGIAHTFQNGHRTKSECLKMANEYILDEQILDKEAHLAYSGGSTWGDGVIRNCTKPTNVKKKR
jgi:hypothetical protein